MWAHQIFFLPVRSVRDQVYRTPVRDFADSQERIYAAVNTITSQMLHYTWVDVQYQLYISRAKNETSSSSSSIAWRQPCAVPECREWSRLFGSLTAIYPLLLPLGGCVAWFLPCTGIFGSLKCLCCEIVEWTENYKSGGSKQERASINLSVNFHILCCATLLTKMWGGARNSFRAMALIWLSFMVIRCATRLFVVTNHSSD